MAGAVVNKVTWKGGTYGYGNHYYHYKYYADKDGAKTNT